MSPRSKRQPDRPTWRIAEAVIRNPTDPDAEPPYNRLEVAFNALEMSVTLREQIDAEVGHPEDATMQAYRSQPRKKLRRPARRQLDEDFYREVAFAYRQAVERGLNPNMTIAEDAGVPYSTAARWIAKAREKRFLGKARQGKVAV